MANEASVTGEVIRVTPLNPDGSLKADASHTFANFISVSFTPEYEDGDEFTQKNAKGAVCVAFKAPDTLKRVNLSIAVCNPDAKIEQLLGGGTLLAGTGENVANEGWASPRVGEDPVPNGVAIEVWSNRIADARKIGHYQWVFPYAKLRASGERVIQNDVLATEFEGWAVGNTKFATGPEAPLWPFVGALESPYAWAKVGLDLPVADS